MDIYLRIKDMCLNFPEVSERISHGQPAFFIRNKKTLAMFRQNETEFEIWCPCEDVNFQQWNLMMPNIFFVPPYMGIYGWIGLRLSLDMNWDIVLSVLTEAYIKVSPKSLSKKLNDNKDNAKKII